MLPGASRAGEVLKGAELEAKKQAGSQGSKWRGFLVFTKPGCQPPSLGLTHAGMQCDKYFLGDLEGTTRLSKDLLHTWVRVVTL